MAARPDIILDPSTIRPGVVQTNPVVAYRIVKRSTNDDGCTHAGAGEQGYAVALEDGAVGATIPVCHLQGNAVIPVKVGTGGATRGSHLVVVADGVANAAAPGVAGTQHIVGEATQTGVAGDLIGMIPHPFVGPRV